MAGKSWAKPVFFAVIFLITFSTLAYAAQSLEPDTPPETFMVPNGRYGDHVEYNTVLEAKSYHQECLWGIWGSQQCPPAAPMAAPIEFRQERRQVYDVDGPIETIDAYTNPHNTVRLTQTDYMIWASHPRPTDDPLADKTSVYYDLETREMVRKSRLLINHRPWLGPVDAAPSNRSEDFFWPQLSLQWPWPQFTPLFALMAETVSPDSNLSRIPYHSNTGCPPDLPSCYHRGLSPMVSQLNGVTVHGLRFEEGGTWSQLSGRATEWINLTLWFAPEATYPVRIEYESNTVACFDGCAFRAYFVERETATLVAFNAGAQPIGWGGPHRELVDQGPHRHEAKAGRHPVSGPGFQGTYPLEAAIQAVENDASLVQYKLWRLQHPNARLIGFQMGYAPPQTVGPVWHLTYGTSGADTVMVIATHRVGMTSVNRILGLSMAPSSPRSNGTTST